MTGIIDCSKKDGKIATFVGKKNDRPMELSREVGIKRTIVNCIHRVPAEDRKSGEVSC